MLYYILASSVEYIIGSSLVVFAFATVISSGVKPEEFQETGRVAQITPLYLTERYTATIALVQRIA